MTAALGCDGARVRRCGCEFECWRKTGPHLKEEKLRILNKFVAVTGYHRKHAIRLFNTQPGVSGRGAAASVGAPD
jgi:hypothetical protein